MYRFVGNDPGQPGHLNPDYNPRFRTIATNFQGWPGLYTVTDEAPTQVAATALAPGHHRRPTRPQCDLGATTTRSCSPSTGPTSGSDTARDTARGHGQRARLRRHAGHR